MTKDEAQAKAIEMVTSKESITGKTTELLALVADIAQALSAAWDEGFTDGLTTGRQELIDGTVVPLPRKSN